MLDTAVLDNGFRVDRWEVRPRLGTVASADRVNRVEPRVMAVLVCLARHAPDVVTREEFIREVWQGRVVTDEVLSRCISLLRAALDDQARESRLVQTLPRIGYRLAVPVEPMESALAAPIAPPERVPAAAARAVPQPGVWSAAQRWSLPIAALAAAAALGYWLSGSMRSPGRSPQAATAPNSIAVLPFVNHSDAADDQYFSDGLSEELIARLSSIDGLKVVASTSAFSLRDRPEDVRAIGRRLSAAYVVEGNVRRDGERVRITAQLIDAGSGYHLMSQTYEGLLSDIFALQDQVAIGIVDRLSTVLSDIEPGRPVGTTPPTRNVVAYELVLRGRHQFRIREESNIRRSIDLFEQAIGLDPDYVEAYADLARALVVLPAYSAEDEEEMFEAALATLDRGAQRNPGIVEMTHDVMGFVHHARWRWGDADAEFRRALELRPGDSNLLQWYSQFLASVGRTRESLDYALKAKNIDVISPVVNDRLAVAYLWNDQDELADRQFAVTRELGIRIAAEPDAYLLLLLRLGRYDEARTLALSLQKMFARPAEWLDPFLAALADESLRGAAVQAVARAERERNISRRYALGAWMHLGEDRRAIEAVWQLMKDRPEFAVELLFAREARGLRTQPGFGEVLAAMGLIDYWEANGWPDVCGRVEGQIRCH